MDPKHLVFISFCLGSMVIALHWSAALIYGAFRSTDLFKDNIIQCDNVLYTFSKENLVEELTQALRIKGVLDE